MTGDTRRVCPYADTIVTPNLSSPTEAEPTTVGDLPTPALIVDRARFDRNVAAMAAVHPGRALRPHVKAFKSTALAAELLAAGHRSFCAATVREIEGMAAAGLSEDLLLANEVVSYERLGALVRQGHPITVAVDSEETISAAAAAGVRRALIDVDVGLPRCGCSPENAGRLAAKARSAGLEVRGVMGYEGHLMMVLDPAEKVERVEQSMARLLAASAEVGGDVISAGGTGTYAANRWATEIQAGSYCLMDTDYARLGLPFEQAISIVGAVISVNQRGWHVVDAGLKSFAMDHGNPTPVLGELMFCSDEHATLKGTAASVGDRVQFWPAHVDPTVAKHRTMWVIGGSDDEPLVERPVQDRWAVDLLHW